MRLRSERHARQASPPIFARESDDALILGLRLSELHTNSRGSAHGGLIAALADNAMGLSCARRFDPPVTANLAIDYFGTARLGQCLAFETRFIRTGGTLCFADISVTADGEPCARANATFRTLR